MFIFKGSGREKGEQVREGRAWWGLVGSLSPEAGKGRSVSVFLGSDSPDFLRPGPHPQ